MVLMGVRLCWNLFCVSRGSHDPFTLPSLEQACMAADKGKGSGDQVSNRRHKFTIVRVLETVG